MRRRTTVIIVAMVFAIAGLAVGFVLAERYGIRPSSEALLTRIAAMAPNGASTTPVVIVSIKENASTSPQVNIEYPQFPGLPVGLNDAIASATLSRLADFRQAAGYTMKARAATGDPRAVISPSDYSFIASWQPTQMNSRYISFIERYDSYTGGANENQDLQTFDYEADGTGSGGTTADNASGRSIDSSGSSGKMLTLADMFPGVSDYLTQVSYIARSQLTDSLAQASGGNVQISMLNNGTTPDSANFRNFTFTDYAVTIYFPKYAVAPGSFGEQHVVISRDTIR
ncbi:MAG: DUF3298 domain-containing protein [Patescibacteria group bacterium]|nr:DUF3298 domain-containing protein [Patescibacteria group bacterium]